MFLYSKKLVRHVPVQQKACAPCSCTAKSLCAMFLNSKKLVCHVPEQQKACVPDYVFGKSLDVSLCGKVSL
jgi:hypothetical protein